LRESCTTLYEYAELIRDVASAVGEDLAEGEADFPPLSMN
jgi:hypothetical protein